MLNELLGLIFSNNINGIPIILVMAIPFFIGLVIGLLIKKFFKIIIIFAIITLIFSYLGFLTINLSLLKSISDTYGPLIIHYITVITGILPIGLGLVAGLIIGFFFG
ncbi:MAG: hypothetical protein AC479_02460 [miscellaneous Crenarchaeota group-6 archaeon AD8-1]|nr:MAG: hypothetical protein AC479_02460 [miscellaneous Crenarchaeota group-6 archaeon AD8-1]